MVETQIPTELVSAQGNLSGSYDVPTAIDLSWDPAATGTHVLSLTKINHHVNEPTFTECTVPGESGELHIDGDMLQPLAVVTGLEFQAIRLARVAAAQIDEGCIEFELSSTHFVSGL